MRPLISYQVKIKKELRIVRILIELQKEIDKVLQEKRTAHLVLEKDKKLILLYPTMKTVRDRITKNEAKIERLYTRVTALIKRKTLIELYRKTSCIHEKID